MRAHFLALCTLATLGLGCAVQNATPTDDEGDSESAEGAVSASSTSTFVRVRPDLRKCMAPMCGGWWVSRVNFSNTKCADGKWARECYVADIDWTKTGLPSSVTDALSPSTLVIRGEMVPSTMGSFSTATLSAKEAWASATDATATGTFYRVEDNGIRCFRAPCFNVEADKLNSTVQRSLSSLDGDYGSKAASLLGLEKVIVAGDVHEVKGGGRAIAVSAFWTRVTAPTDPLACKVDADCTVTAYSKPVSTSSECYCARCAFAVMNTSTASANEASWSKLCGGKPMICPMIMCIKPPTVTCTAGVCTKVDGL